MLQSIYVLKLVHLSVADLYVTKMKTARAAEDILFSVIELVYVCVSLISIRFNIWQAGAFNRGGIGQYESSFLVSVVWAMIYEYM